MRIAISTKELYQQVLGDGVRFTEWPSVFFRVTRRNFCGQIEFRVVNAFFGCLRGCQIIQSK